MLESIHYELDTRCTPAKLHADPAATLTSAFQSTQDQLMAYARHASQCTHLLCTLHCTLHSPRGVRRACCRLAAEEPMRVDATESGACALVAYLRERKLWVVRPPATELGTAAAAASPATLC